MTAKPPTILVVDDEAPIREMVEFTLSADGIDCVGAVSINEAKACIEASRPDLILLDWMLPGGESGLDFAKALRADSQHRDIPLIMLTARVDNADKVAALDAGADDYVAKPFSPSELKARIRAVLRRARSPGAPPDSEVIEIERLRLNVSTRRVSVDGELIELGPTEFRLLHFLMRHLERVYSRAELIQYLWPPNTYVEERTVDVHILKLRRALQAHGCRNMIQTVRGAGYRFSVR